jgi:hypothetical protein
MEWQPIATAPKDRAILLFCAETEEQAVCAHMTALEDGEQAWIMARGHNDLGLMISFAFRDPTHWMPLPPSPGGE